MQRKWTKIYTTSLFVDIQFALGWEVGGSYGKQQEKWTTIRHSLPRVRAKTLVNLKWRTILCIMWVISLLQNCPMIALSVVDIDQNISVAFASHTHKRYWQSEYRSLGQICTKTTKKTPIVGPKYRSGNPSNRTLAALYIILIRIIRTVTNHWIYSSYLGCSALTNDRISTSA